LPGKAKGKEKGSKGKGALLERKRLPRKAKATRRRKGKAVY
jgi:hypothetical protein